MPAATAGVLGRPVSHSLSPLLHRAAYAELGLDWAYEAVDCGEDDLPRVVAARADWAGFSCTMPLKRAALDFADESTDLARAVGAANTLIPRDGGWLADNTDVIGVSAALAEAGVAPSVVTVLGAGGTAQAVIAALAGLGVESCRVLVRDPTRSARLCDTALAVGVEVVVGPLTVADPGLEAPLVVSTLPAGAADHLAAAPWRADQAVLDVVYVPWPTELARAAAGRGATVLGGREMLLHQAAEQVRLMTGHDAPLEAMRAALDASH